LRILSQLSSIWATDRASIKLYRFTDGITNTLIKATLSPSGEASSSRSGAAHGDPNPAPVLIRAYGKDTETLIDRRKELRAHHHLAERGLAPALLATFDNGFLYGFVEGEPCTAEDFRMRSVWRGIAERLGEWHALLDISVLALDDESKADRTEVEREERLVPTIWTNARKWISLLGSETSLSGEKNLELVRELEWLIELLGRVQGIRGRNVVFSHTDLLCANIILEPESTTKSKSQAESGTQTNDPDSSRAVTIIDYEYATAAPAAFDIANFFAEWAGPDGEIACMPSHSQRKDFIQYYVRSFHSYTKNNNSCTVNTKAEPDMNVEADVESLMQHVDLYRGLPGFYWGVWGLIQAGISEIDFDYTSYAARRFGEFEAWKEEYTGVRKREGREMGPREEAWARE